MATQVVYTPQTRPTIIKLHPGLAMSDEQFFEFCQINSAHQFERTAQGEIIIMSPTGSESGNRNASLTVQVGSWAERDGSGLIFDSSTGFTLPNGAVRSPDVSWIGRSRWDAIPPEQRKKFAPICPDFVIELRSESDDLGMLKDKMQEYIENGAALGWLIDPIAQQVYVYQPGAPVQQIDQPTTLSGEPTLPGFVLDLGKIWG
ncbi:MAG: Uma2 family endonuclease [Cyanobacteriota bacterium]